MDRLWSPWRGEHLARHTEEARAGLHDDGPSVFARIAAEPEQDAAHFVLHRGTTVFAVMNRYPYTNGHVLVLPYRQVEDYDALTEAERAELAHLTARVIGWIRSALAPDGFNIGVNQGSAAGAGIPRHLHQHIVPRWSGDTNFMPVLGQTKVIPESVAVTYARLVEARNAEGETAV